MPNNFHIQLLNKKVVRHLLNYMTYIITYLHKTNTFTHHITLIQHIYVFFFLEFQHPLIISMFMSKKIKLINKL